MATKKYQAKNTCKGVIPFWVNDVVGKDNYKELQRGNAVSLSDIKHRGVFEFLVEASGEPKRARNAKGQLKADDPSTPDVNEAYEGGKGPKKSKKGDK